MISVDNLNFSRPTEAFLPLVTAQLNTSILLCPTFYCLILSARIFCQG